MTHEHQLPVDAIQGLESELIAMREHLHAHPELSFEEHQTAAYICSRLEAHGIPFRARVAGTGIVVDIQGAGPGATVALRGDMDALPIQEKNEVAYRSKYDGVMHACGHDVHTTCLFGALRYLHERRSEWNGHIRGIFQPGEEKLPGGAGMMIAQGVLESPNVDAIIALHVFPGLSVGHLGFRPGMYMASADEIHMTINGKGGHAAMPRDVIDPIMISAQLITALQSLVSRKAPPTVPTVLSFGYIQGLGATNVIPDSVHIKGTFRTLDEEWRMEAHRIIADMCDRICAAYGATVQLEVKKGYPFLQNNHTLTEVCRQAAEQHFGSEHVHHLPIRMTGEDFAFYSQHAPACFFRLGTAAPDGGFQHGVHHPRFDIHPGAIRIGASAMALLALAALDGTSG